MSQFAFLQRDWSAVHDAAARELFHVTYWLARTYGRAARPAAVAVAA